jgi:aspartate aminotransferase
MMHATSEHLRRLHDAIGHFSDWALSGSGVASPTGSDFLFGNPHDMAPAGYVDALMRGAQPTGPDHYAYKMSEPVATEAVAASLRDRFAMPFTAEDVSMTNGNFTGLSVALATVADPGDEVIYVSPPWFFYETLILAGGMTPVRVDADRTTFDLDLDAIRAAITQRTRAIIVNSPNNPSGRIYGTDVLLSLGEMLEEASAENDRRIYLLSDEAYNRIVFDGRDFPTPTAHYPHSFLLYTYAKTLLAPGSRLGYIAMPPAMPEREELRAALTLSTITSGWGFPVSLLQQALPDLEALPAGIERLQARRDRLCPALQEQGYELIVPEGTFYVLVRSPLEDDEVFCKTLAAHDVFVLPGAMFEMPGWFRISLTANDEMVKRSIPGFAAGIAEARP